MSRYTDAALLKGDYAKMIKEPPKEAEWEKKASCDNKAEAIAQEVAKHIFAMSQGLDPNSERLEITTYSAKGPIIVMRITPGDGALIRIDGVFSDGKLPISIVQHAAQLSMTFTRVPAIADGEAEKEEGGRQIGFVIFDELKKRKEARTAAKRTAAKRKTASKKRTAKK